MATAISYTSIELYLKSDYEPDAEYVDGVIEVRPVGEYDHATWQYAIQKWFDSHGREWNIRVRPELRVQVAPTRFCVPDVTVLDRAMAIEQIITHAPLAVFEILSPEDTIQRSLRKLADYANMGVPQIWVIDPSTRRYYRFSEGKLEPVTHFGAPGDRIYFSMSEVEALLD